MVLGAISLISPLDYRGDFRPYFTIYDPEYKIYQDKYDRKVIKNCLLGVTNPFFMKVIIQKSKIIKLLLIFLLGNEKFSKCFIFRL